MNPIELQARREALGLSQAELAQRLGVSQAIISAWENGTRSPRDPVDILTELAELADLQRDMIDQTIDRIEGASAKLNNPRVTVYTYRSDADYWADDSHAKTQGIPASMHRLATALAVIESEADMAVSVSISKRSD